MAEVTAFNSDKLAFVYESDAAASFLVVNCKTKLLEYQVSMLEHNNISFVMPFNVIRKDGVNCFYYKISSKIPLAFLLKRRKFNREEFLKFLVNITAAVNESTGYLLSDTNFVFNPEFIYINPDTLEPALVYIPAMLESDCAVTIQAFVSDLLMQHINIDGFDNENLVHRILASVNSQSFYISGFMRLLRELLYERSGDSTKPDELSTDQTDSNDDEKIKLSVTKGNRLKFPVLAIFAQAAIGIVIYMCRGFLNNVSENPAATYAAVIIIVLALELLLFKKMKEAGLIIFDSSGESDITGKSIEQPQSKNSLERQINTRNNKKAENPGNPLEQKYRKFIEEINQTAADEAAASATESPELQPKELQPNELRPKELRPKELQPKMSLGVTSYNRNIAIDGKSSSAVSAFNAPSSKTELLGNYNYKVRVLKSRWKKNGEDDIYIDKDDFLIGRLEGHVDYTLNNMAVGKLHLHMICKDGTCYIKDLNSVNGTFINGERIESNKEYVLKDNDILRIANSEFEFFGGCYS